METFNNNKTEMRERQLWGGGRRRRKKRRKKRRRKRRRKKRRRRKRKGGGGGGIPQTHKSININNDNTFFSVASFSTVETVCQNQSPWFLFLRK